MQNSTGGRKNTPNLRVCLVTSYAMHTNLSTATVLSASASLPLCSGVCSEPDDDDGAPDGGSSIGAVSSSGSGRGESCSEELQLSHSFGTRTRSCKTKDTYNMNGFTVTTRVRMLNLDF